LPRTWDRYCTPAPVDSCSVACASFAGSARPSGDNGGGGGSAPPPLCLRRCCAPPPPLLLLLPPVAASWLRLLWRWASLCSHCSRGLHGFGSTSAAAPLPSTTRPRGGRGEVPPASMLLPAAAPSARHAAMPSAAPTTGPVGTCSTWPIATSRFASILRNPAATKLDWSRARSASSPEPPPSLLSRSRLTSSSKPHLTELHSESPTTLKPFSRRQQEQQKQRASVAAIASKGVCKSLAV